jgi:hypothetical protein
MGQHYARGFCVVYLGSRHTDHQLDVRVLGSDSLEFAIRTARSRVENMAFAGANDAQAPVGFVIENSEGDELFRWYRGD